MGLVLLPGMDLQLWLNFYNSFEDADLRKGSWLVGQQFTADGKPILDDGQPLAFTPEIPALVMPAGPEARRAGARFKK